WLWTTWTHFMVVGVIAANILFFAMTQVFYLPKLRKIQSEGWLDSELGHEPVMVRLESVLRGLTWAADHATGLLLLAAGAWGLFEWRVRGENKALMRLSALGTAGLALTLAAA